MKNLVIICALTILTYSVSVAQSGDKDAIISALQYEIKELIRQNEALKAEIAQLRNSGSGSSNLAEEYKVQLGIQNPDNLVGPLNKPRVISSNNVNGKQVYGIGGFTNPSEAYQLSQEMRKLNLAGSFVTRYVNGVRDMNYSYTGPTSSSPNSKINYSKSEVENTKMTPPPTYSGGDNYSTGPVKVPGVPSKTLVIEE